MARALIVGCGCRGRALGVALSERGWAVRGTSRSEARLALIEAAGIEAAAADPDRPGTVLDVIDGVAAVFWLMGTAQDEPEVIAAIHGPRLESLLERLVDTPVRGFFYEGGGTVQPHNFERGSSAVEAAGARWRIPTAVVATDPADHDAWLEAMLSASEVLIS